MSTESTTLIDDKEKDNANNDMGAKKVDIEHQPLRTASSSLSTDTPSAPVKQRINPEIRDTIKLLYGAGGIYAAFLYYGSLQEDVFTFTGEDDIKFKQAWFLQVLEAFANVMVGAAGLWITGGATKLMPQKFFAISGASQVSAKAFTSSSLAHGLSFPVATLAKSAKMAPVMAGSLILGGAVYTLREYIQVLAIIAGTAILSMSKKKGGKIQSTPIGLLFVIAALAMDGVTGGVQKRLMADMNKVGLKPKPYDFMFFTNLYMMIFGWLVAVGLGEFLSGIQYCVTNPDIVPLILKFSMCSAIGQSFIFYTVAHFDPLVCSTVTTTRKIFSVMLSLLFKGHSLTSQSWCGVALACTGIASEVENKCRKSKAKKKEGQFGV